jgi:hypothetical protein
VRRYILNRFRTRNAHRVEPFRAGAVEQRRLERREI